MKADVISLVILLCLMGTGRLNAQRQHPEFDPDAKYRKNTLPMKREVSAPVAPADTVESDHTVGCFPSPARDYIDIVSKGNDKIGHVTMWSKSNHAWLSLFFPGNYAGSNCVRVDITGMPDGVYMIHTEFYNGCSAYSKVIVISSKVVVIR